MPSRYYSEMRWPLELLIDDSGDFAPKRAKPIGNKGSPVAKNLLQTLTSNSRVAVALLMICCTVCPMCVSSELAFSRNKKRSVRLRDANPPPKTP